FAATSPMHLPCASGSCQMTASPSAVRRTSNSKPSHPSAKARSKEAIVFSRIDRIPRAPRWPSSSGRGRSVLMRRNQSRSKSRIGLPVSGDSFAFRSASWNFFSSRSEACFWASTDCWKIESRRLSCSRMALAAASISAKVLGFTAATWEITALVSPSTLRTALQQGQVTSKFAGVFFAISANHTGNRALRPRSALALLTGLVAKAEGEDVQHIQHFPAKQENGNYHHHHGEDLSE